MKLRLSVISCCLLLNLLVLLYIYNIRTKPEQQTIYKYVNKRSLEKNGSRSSTDTSWECVDRGQIPYLAQKGDYWVYYNLFPASQRYGCYESITFTTHADFTFLDNLMPLLARWMGPISVALYAPGEDFHLTIKSILYLRQCQDEIVNQFVTFHVYFHNKHIPVNFTQMDTIQCDCDTPPWIGFDSSRLYRIRHRLMYPVNVGRNIARQEATTWYILPADIELYPSAELITNFLNMIKEQDKMYRRPNPKVYPLVIFEVKEGKNIPSTKKQLLTMVKQKLAISFHQDICDACHKIPRYKEWLRASQKNGIHVFHVAKRTGYLSHWEPIFIGTHEDPMYDERLSWEGMSDKMTQGYTFCLLDYEFHILDNAFIVHRPGIKTVKQHIDERREELVLQTKHLINDVIKPELKRLYGTRSTCII